jgi:predicted transcriptional regulator of viral defense system
MKLQQTYEERTLALAKEQGVLRPRDLEKRGIPRRYAYALARAGRLRRVGRGLYVHPENPLTENRSLALIGKRSPDAVVCLLSALRFHELTTQLPSETWVAIHPKARPPQIAEIPLRVVRFSGKALTEGSEDHIIEGVTVHITNPSKTVADCFKYRNKIGRDVAVEALRDAIAQRKTTVQELDRFAHICRVARIMRPYLELYL